MVHLFTVLSLPRARASSYAGLPSKLEMLQKTSRWFILHPTTIVAAEMRQYCGRSTVVLWVTCDFDSHRNAADAVVPPPSSTML